jgi:hypothetical protein
MTRGEVFLAIVGAAILIVGMVGLFVTLRAVR